MKLPQGGGSSAAACSHLAFCPKEQRRNETKCFCANNGSQGLPTTPAQTQVSQLTLALWRHQMFKHLTLEIIASPNHAWLGFLGLNVGQAASTVQTPGTTSPLAKKKT